MRKKVFFLLLFFSSVTFAENTILAIVNNTPLTLNSVQTELEKLSTKDEKLQIINNYIYTN